MDDDQLKLEDVIAEMDPTGRLHFEVAQLRVVVKKQAARIAELENAQTAAPGE